MSDENEIIALREERDALLADRDDLIQKLRDRDAESVERDALRQRLGYLLGAFTGEDGVILSHSKTESLLADVDLALSYGVGDPDRHVLLHAEPPQLRTNHDGHYFPISWLYDDGRPVISSEHDQVVLRLSSDAVDTDEAAIQFVSQLTRCWNRFGRYFLPMSEPLWFYRLEDDDEDDNRLIDDCESFEDAVKEAYLNCREGASVRLTLARVYRDGIAPTDEVEKFAQVLELHKIRLTAVAPFWESAEA